MFRALLAHPQEVAAQTALGILRACYVSWLHKGLYMFRSNPGAAN
jgi:hypothetical protein